MTGFVSSLRELPEEASERVRAGYEALGNCRVCPRSCGVDRLSGETGTCRTGLLAKVAAANLHFGEEPCLTGTRGSGTVFFSGCNLACDFCQNFPLSQFGQGQEKTPREIAEIFLGLEGRGAHNINLVTPSHVVPQILHALALARKDGLTVPVVYNSNGYDEPAMLRLLEGYVDIYLPDMKYASDLVALRHSKAPGYVERNRAAVREMARQVGPLSLDDRGLARRGLLIRHLLLPGGLSGFGEVARFIREELGQETAVSFMGQYFPTHRALRIPALARRITKDEYDRGLEILFSEGLVEGYVQELEGEDEGLFPASQETEERECQREMTFATS
ncbi:MAG: radical SAM protein [Leptospirillia bacterium]